jgi:nucleoid DNA-binding protein
MVPTLKKIYDELANKYGISAKEVEEVAISQFMLVRKVMQEGTKNKPETFKSVQITHLGKFAVRKHKLEEYKNKANGE